MRVARRYALLITLLLLCGLVLTLVAHAQGPEDEEAAEGGVGASGGVGGMTLADPPPAGYSVLYMFTGAANDSTGDDRITTVVLCTNWGESDVDVQVQFFNANGDPHTGEATITAGDTWTYYPFGQGPSILFTAGAHDTAVGAADFFLSQGSGRVVATGSRVICKALLVAPDGHTAGSDQPAFMANLTMYDGNGRLVGSTRKGYLPIIIRD